MKDKILLGFAAVTHPLILAPLTYLLLDGSYEWEILTLNIIVPLLLFSNFKANLADPSRGDRRKMYLTISVTYLATILFLVAKEGVWHYYYGLFESWLLIMLVMSFIVGKQKISWHGAGWGWLFFYSLGLLYVHGVAEATLGIAAGILVIGIVTVYIRKLQGAHTTQEIIRGYSLGALAAILSVAVSILMK